MFINYSFIKRANCVLKLCENYPSVSSIIYNIGEQNSVVFSYDSNVLLMKFTSGTRSAFQINIYYKKKLNLNLTNRGTSLKCICANTESFTFESEKTNPIYYVSSADKDFIL